MSITPEQLPKKVEQVLSTYSQEVTAEIKKAVTKVTKDMVKETKANAPKDTGEYAKAISSTTLEENANKKIMIWYVRGKKSRLAHLLEYGHAKVNGDKVSGKPHIRPAEEKAVKELEKLVKEAVEK